MCLIVVKNKVDASFSVADFRNSYTRNSDGTGIMYVEDGRVKVEKTNGSTVKEHLEMYYKHMHRPQFVLHHRFATHGTKTEVNVHPFKVLSIDDGDPYDLYMAHNGVIQMSRFAKDSDTSFSDTNLFVQQYLTPLLRKYPDIIEESVFQVMLSDFIGMNNKLAFLRNDGSIWIFNKSQGDEHNGCWLSNKYSIANNQSNVIEYGKKHGTYNHNAYGYEEYEGGAWFKTYAQANRMKRSAENSHSKLTINELLDAVEEYAGLGLVTIEALHTDDPDMVQDMITLLSPKDVAPAFFNSASDIVAGKLYDLLQEYSKKKAA